MLSLWLRTYPAESSLLFATRTFAVTRQARELLQEEKASLCSNKLWFGYRIKYPECYGYVYLWYDRKKRKLCIGSHHKRLRNASVWDGYLTSTGTCKKEIEKRPRDFRFRILDYNVNVDSLKYTQTLEQKWLDKIPENQMEGQTNARYYNQCRVAGGGFSSDSLVAAKISAAHKKAVADGTHHFIHSHPMRDMAAKEKRTATVAKAVASGTHNFIHGNPMKNPIIREIIVAKLKIRAAKSVADGTHNFVRDHPMKNPLTKERMKETVAKAVADGTHNFVRNHPMKNPAIKERAIAKMKVAVAKAVADGTHNFIRCNPSKDPIAKEKRRASIAKSVAEKTHNFVLNNPMKNPDSKAKRKDTFEKKKKH